MPRPDQVDDDAPLGRGQLLDQVGKVGGMQIKAQRLDAREIIGVERRADGGDLAPGNAVELFWLGISGLGARRGVRHALSPGHGRPGRGRPSKNHKARGVNAGPW